MEKKSNHQVKIVKLNAPLVHTNADSLELFQIGGYQVVTKKGQFKEGELAVYIQPDSVVPQTEPFRFIWENYQTEPNGEVPEKRRRITVRKFRKEWSEGLLMSVVDFGGFVTNRDADIYGHVIHEGDDVSDLLGIYHYEPPVREGTGGENERGPKKFNRYPKSLKGWFYFLMYKIFRINLNGSVNGYEKEQGPGLPVYDVDAYKNYTNAFTEGEPVVVTEKIHGSNARFYFDGKKFYVGSRQLWKSAKSKCVWRKAVEQNNWIELWCRANPGYALYGEVVPTQREPFDYGCTNGQVRFFVFDVLKPNKEWANWDELEDIRKQVTWVPMLYNGPFNIEKIKQLVDGKSTVSNANHIREGIVVKPVQERHVVGLGRLCLKLVSNLYLAL